MSGDLRVLCLNAGSSSLKFALWELGQSERALVSGAADGVGIASARLVLRDARGHVLHDSALEFTDTRSVARAAFDALATLQLPAPHALGHRIVHGGPVYAAPRLVDEPLMAALNELVPFAPLHMPAGLAGIEAARARFPQLPQVACFDTAFHRRMPELAQRLPLPRALWDAGVRRYGFHGLSYEYVVQQLGAAVSGRVIVAHLGNGASMVALRDGEPLDTSMGLTPTGGLPMGTRSGDLDPGVLIHLQAAHGYTTAKLETLVNHEAGLLGVSGLSADVKTLLEARATNVHAAQAIELFCYAIRKQVGAFAAALGGIDCLVFTGGIGEHSAPVRAAVCHGLEFLGITLDHQANRDGAALIHAQHSTCKVRVLATDEDRMIARHVRALISPAAQPAAP